MGLEHNPNMFSRMYFASRAGSGRVTRPTDRRSPLKEDRPNLFPSSRRGVYPMSRTAKRFRSLVITIIAIAATNFALSYASSLPMSSGSAPISKMGVGVRPESPRPKMAVGVRPESPRPKMAVGVRPESPRPKMAVGVRPESPRP